MSNEDNTDDVDEPPIPEEARAAAGGAEQSDFVEYGIEDKPPLLESIFLGFQHYLTMVGATIAIPLVLAGAMGMPADVTAKLIGTFFVVSGVATLAQTTLGNRYPLVQGGTFSMLAPALAIIGVIASSGGGWETMILELQGAVIVAGIAEIFIGYLGIMGWLKRHMGPIVIAPVIALIGLALFSVPQITSATQNWWLLGLTVLLIVLFSQYLNNYNRAFRLFPVLLALVAAWLVAAVLSFTGIYAAGTAGYINFDTVANADPILAIYPLQWGMPQFTGSFIIGMFAGMLASVIESFGDYHSVARMAGKGAPNAQRVNHGIGMEGIGNTFAGLMGTGNGSTSYTENVGAIGITGVASRYVVQIGAIVMLFVGFVGYFGQLVATIPNPIVGGLFLAMFGQIAAVGLSQLKFVDLDKNRNVFIIGIALFAGLAIPAYMGNVGGASAFQTGLAGEFPFTLLEGVEVAGVSPLGIIATTTFVIGSTGMAVGGIVAFVLDNTIPGTREERGLTTWEDITEDADDFKPFWERMGDGDDERPAPGGD
ncbi:uracil-xanthine permease family protein [Haloarchaeobius litoreus]|uniref:Uracil-xanthine permease family protein n=1 Tax=Haloarchaeobius litoreus TaxID=755306 RepID=A0ABD6DDY5_9EURY|nr:solute carrier family 23 protein [Haloarchaeobius litoreus]